MYICMHIYLSSSLSIFPNSKHMYVCMYVCLHTYYTYIYTHTHFFRNHVRSLKDLRETTKKPPKPLKPSPEEPSTACPKLMFFFVELLFPPKVSAVDERPHGSGESSPLTHLRLQGGKTKRKARPQPSQAEPCIAAEDSQHRNLRT